MKPSFRQRGLAWIVVRDRKRSKKRKKTSIDTTQKYIYKTREEHRFSTSGAYITEKQNECVTIHRKRREYYRAIQARTDALRFTENGAYITKRHKTERVHCNSQEKRCVL